MAKHRRRPEETVVQEQTRLRGLPDQASETAKARFGGQQGRRQRKRRQASLAHAEQGGVVQTPGQLATPAREPRHPDADKTGYDAIKEVLED